MLWRNGLIMYHVTYFVNVYYCFFISAFSLMHVFLWMFASPDPRHLAWPPALGLVSQIVFTSPGPQFIFTSPGLQFYCQSGAWVCIYWPCLLNLYLYLWPWPTICINGPGHEFAFTLLLLIVAVVVVIVVVAISLKQIIPIFVCRF